MHPDWILPDWPAPANVRAVMTTRAGGVSRPPFDSFNPAGHVGDDPAAVAENRRILREWLPAEPLWLNQVHGTRVFELILSPSCKATSIPLPTSPTCGGGWEGEIRVGTSKTGQSPLTPSLTPSLTPFIPERGLFPGGEITPEADACLTRQPGQVCAVLTADCLPVLFCDQGGTVVAAAHAGWRGLAAGVLEETVRSMNLDPGRILAWLGAAIGPESFEVGPEVREAFIARHPLAGIAFRPALPGTLDETPRKWLADIAMLARIRLAAVGVERVYGGGLCTFRDSRRFFSYRRDGQTGRMAALIWMNGA